MKCSCKIKINVVEYRSSMEMYRSGRNENDSKSFCP